MEWLPWPGGPTACTVSASASPEIGNGRPSAAKGTSQVRLFWAIQVDSVGLQEPLWEAGRRVRGRGSGAGAGRTLPGGLSGWTLSQGVQAAPGGWCRQGRGAFPEPPETQAADTVILVRGDPFWTLVSGTAETQIRVVSKALGLRSSATAARGRACNP